MAKDGGTATKGKQNGKKNGGLTSGLKRVSKGKRGKDLEETDTEDIKKYVLQSSSIEVVLTQHSEPEYSDGGQAATPPKTPNANADKVISGRVAKRISPRKVSIKNYKKLENPFAEMELANEDGESIFGKPERSEEEDSNPSDEDYGHQNMAVKVEDEV